MAIPGASSGKTLGEQFRQARASAARHTVSIMRNPSDQRSFPNRTCVFAAVSLIFFFLNVATFTSLGVVLYAMLSELHWSMTAAGFSFTLLGLACGLSSPLPALTMKWIGG